MNEKLPAKLFPKLVFGRYLVTKKLGRGRFATVYLAKDQHIPRLVALKIPSKSTRQNARLLQAFRSESRAAALPWHSHLIKVLDAGESRNGPYIVLEYCSGPTLSEWILLHRTTLTPRLAARYVAEIATGAGIAHDAGIVHRDIKSSNVLMDLSVENSKHATPKLTDFGVAFYPGDLCDAVIVGTPGYTAPEQVIGSTPQPQNDVYGLGAILYELLTGRRVTACPATPLPHSVPSVLAAICHRCLNPMLLDRYRDGHSLAADLNCYLKSRPTIAAKPGLPGCAILWFRRSPLRAALMILSLLMTFMIVANTIHESIRTERDNRMLRISNDQEKRATSNAEEAERKKDFMAEQAKDQAFRSQLQIAGHRLFQPLALTMRDVPSQPRNSIHHFATLYLDRLAEQTILCTPHHGGIHAIAASANGRYVASVCGENWDVRDALSKKLPNVRGGCHQVPLTGPLALSNDGQMLAAIEQQPGGLQRTVLLTGRNKPAVIPSHAEQGRPMGFDSVGRFLMHHPHAIYVIDPCNGSVIDSLPFPNRMASFSADGETLALAPTFATGLMIIDWKTKQPRTTIPVTTSFQTIALSDHGRLLATNEELWDISKEVPQRLDVMKTRGHVSIQPDETVVLISHGTGDQSDKVLCHLRSSNGGWNQTVVPAGVKVTTCAVSNNFILIGGLDGTLRRQSVIPAPRYESWLAHTPNEAWAIDTTEDAGLITGGDDGLIRIWPKLGPYMVLKEEKPPVFPHLVIAAVVSPDGRTLASGGSDRVVRRWDLRHQKEIQPPLHYGHWVRAIAWSADGRTIMAAGDGSGVRAWNVSDNRTWDFLPSIRRATSIVALANGQAVTLQNDGQIRWWNIDTGECLRSQPEGHVPKCLALSPDQRFLAIGTNAGSVILCNALTGQVFWRSIVMINRVNAVAWSPNNEIIAVAGNDSKVSLLWADTGGPIFSLPAPPAGPPAEKVVESSSGDHVNGLRFSRDGLHLYATRMDGRVVAWHAAD